MNNDQIKSLVRLLLNTASGAIIAWSASKSQSAKDTGQFLANFINGPDALALGMTAVAWIWGHLAHSNGPETPQPTSAPPPKSTGSGGTLGLWLSLGALAGLMVAGCAGIAPGNDPLVVRVEQTQTTAKGAFDLVLKVDNADRGFYKTNAAGFHGFCEWLRVKVPTSDGGVLPRASAMLWTLDAEKLAYKAGTASSNNLVLVWDMVQTNLTQAQTWLLAVTNSLAK